MGSSDIVDWVAIVAIASILIIEWQVFQIKASLAEINRKLRVLFKGLNIDPSPVSVGPSPVSVDASINDRVKALVAEGKKIQAIKLYREETGLGLKEAKDAVEELVQR